MKGMSCQYVAHTPFVLRGYENFIIIKELKLLHKSEKRYIIICDRIYEVACYEKAVKGIYKWQKL